MGKQIEVYPHGGILLSPTKEKLSTHIITWMNFINIVMVSQSQTQMHDSIYIKFKSDKTNLW